MLRFVLVLTFAVVGILEAQEWSACSGLFALNVSEICVDPTNHAIVFAASGGGAFKSTNKGATWLSLPTAGKKVAINPLNSNTVVVGNSISLDGGATFSGWNSPLQTIDLSSITFYPNDSSSLLIGSTRGVIFKTSDGGKNWQNLNNGIDTCAISCIITDLFIDPQNSNTILVAKRHPPALGRLYKSTDGGISWSEKLYESVNAIISHIATDDVLYAGTDDGVYVSSDLGDSWNILGLSGSSVRAIAQSPKNNSILLVGTLGEGVWKSTDAGVTWFPYNEGIPGFSYALNVNSLAALDENQLLVGTGAGCYNGSFTDTSWNESNAGFFPITAYNFAGSSNGDTVYLVGTSGVFRSTNGSLDWVFVGGLYGVAIAVHPANAEKVFTSIITPVDNRILVSTSGGYAWSDLGVSYLGNISAIKIARSNPAYVYAIGNGPRFLKTSDGGVSWEEINLPTTPNSILIHPSDEHHVMIGGTNGIFESYDGGASWKQNDLQSTSHAIRLAERDEFTDLFAAIEDIGLFKSTDLGKSWNAVNLSFPAKNILSIELTAKNSNVILIGVQDSGVFISEDGGFSWEAKNEGLPSKSVTSLHVLNQSDVLVGLDQNAVYRNSSLLDAVPYYPEREIIAPSSTVSISVRPSTMNASFRIHPGEIPKVIICDVLGRKIFSTELSPNGSGQYTFEWNSKRNDGVPVGSGVYFLAIETKMDRKFGRFVLLH